MGTAFLCHPCRAPTLGKVTWRWCSRREEKGTNLPAPPWGRDETFVAAEILLGNLSLLPPAPSSVKKNSWPCLFF